VCWVLLYTSFHLQWKSAIQSEIRTIIAQHTNTTASEPLKLHQRLSTIPLSVWEDQTPTLDLVIRETIRLVINGASLRRNTLDDIHASLKVPGVPKGGFIGYNLADAHLNPEIYADPAAFDPERFNPGREEDKREKYAFLGWGAGAWFPDLLSYLLQPQEILANGITQAGTHA
jgi:cytochrome P450